MWGAIESLYEISYYILKNIEGLKWEALLFYLFYLYGKRSGMKMFRKFLQGYFPYLADENEDWRRWATNQIELLGGRKWQPTKQYLHMKRSAKVDPTNLTTSSTLSQEGIGPERRYKMTKLLIAVDDGHGMETAGKRTPNYEDGTFMRENEFNRAVINKLIVHLQRSAFDVVHVSAGDTDVPLKTRTDLANNTKDNGFGRKADAMVSVHANAMGSTWNTKAKGIEIFYRDKYKDGKKLAQDIQEYLVKGTPLINRGLKTANLHITREAKMPAVLIEGAFMDNPDEALLLKSDAYQSECAEEIARGLCQYFGRTYIEVTPAVTLPDGMTPVAVYIGEKQFDGLLSSGRSWVPARDVLTELGIKTWLYQKKAIYINGTAVETKIINTKSYIKSVDLQTLGVVKGVFLEPDAVNTKRVLIYPKESVTNE
jgi:N-acetylmuramoyl-L-alanine amidase